MKLLPAILGVLLTVAGCGPTGGGAEKAELAKVGTAIGELPMIVIPRGQEMSPLSADLGLPAWKAAAVVKLSGMGQEDKDERFATEAKIFCTGKNLYIAWRCGEPEPTSVITSRAEIWNRDSVELFIEPRESLVKRPYHHIAIDASGGATFVREHVYSRYFQLKSCEEKWQPGAEIKVERGAAGWVCVLRMPLSDLHVGSEAQDGGLWRVNLCRTRPERDARLRTDGMYWSWSPVKGPFNSPTRFGYAIPGMYAKVDLVEHVKKLDAEAPRDASAARATDPATAAKIDQLLAAYWGNQELLKQLEALAYQGEAMYALVSKKVSAAIAERTHYAEARELQYLLERDRPDLDPPPQDVLDRVARFVPATVSYEGQTLGYRLFRPDLQSGKKYPLVIFLHGSAERGSDNRRQLFGGAIEYGKDRVQAKYPCFVMAPQCPIAGSGWADTRSNLDSAAVMKASSNYRLAEKPGQTTVLLLKAIDEVLAKNSAIDRSRIYIAGSSLGGFGTWEMLMRRPELFAAGVVMCGGGDQTKASLLKDVPIWDFHGALDMSVKPEASREMKAAMERIGGKAKFTEFPDRGHGLGEPNMEADVLEWMFSQKRP